MLNTPDIAWQRFAILLTGTAAVLAIVTYLFILLANPFGIAPFAPDKPRAILDANQRFMYPQLIRAKRHDSLVIGTSTSRLLEPAKLNEAFGGRFANLALSDGRAWEQYRIADLVIRTSGAPRRLIVGLDRVWCDADADVARITYRGFPEWMYDDNPWNDMLHVYNAKTLEISARRIADLFGMARVRFDGDGFGDFTPGEAAYDVARAKEHLWQGREQRIIPQNPPFAASDAVESSWTFPALRWLEEILRRVDGRSEVYLVFMPVHVTAQPIPGSEAASREQECKRRVREMGRSI